MAEQAQDFELEFPAQAGSLAALRQQSRAVLARLGCSEADIEEILLGLCEAVANVIRHGYCGDCGEKVGLSIRRRGPELEFEVRDSAPPLDPAGVHPRDLDDLRPGGLGTHFMRSVMTEVRYGHLPGGRGNALTMRWRRRQQQPEDS